MRMTHTNIGLNRICRLFGVTRQAYYQHLNRSLDTELWHELVVQEVIKIRAHHPRIGTRKLYVLLEGFMLEHQIKMGRDALFDLLSTYGLLIRRRKRLVKTTQSHHWLKKYSNLIKDFVPVSPNELYVSDITYWKIANTYLYIHLITDAYSRKIVGYELSETLEAEHSIKALQMALSSLDKNANRYLIHHSDRGVQYCSYKYVKLLQDYQIQISMTENGDPLENAIAERVNGILKEEYLSCYEIDTFKEAKGLLEQVINLYNNERPHMSIGNLVPEKVHSNQLKKGDRKWKNYY
ncbi:IS3 family transposase [Tenacibaculum sp. IMCC1]|uniref:IS3 family transposase n=1 Tax=Tenacibaculum sp. Pbs-1 TaxID=3238748 RepID=A0AB33KWJ2_9FLAO